MFYWNWIKVSFRWHERSFRNQKKTYLYHRGLAEHNLGWNSSHSILAQVWERMSDVCLIKRKLLIRPPTHPHTVLVLHFLYLKKRKKTINIVLFWIYCRPSLMSWFSNRIPHPNTTTSRLADGTKGPVLNLRGRQGIVCRMPLMAMSA